LLELGIVGFVAWIWLFVRVVRRLLRAGRRSADGDDWLFIGLAAAIASYAVGLLTYDGFSFIQTTFVFWILLGLAAVALRDTPVLRPDRVRPR
jgi:O-antigen ligase